ncbi:MAG: SDH family Clp fold serine proteinase [bacterium]
MPIDTEPLRHDNALASLPDWWLNSKLQEIEKRTENDVLSIYGNILPGIDMRVRLAIEALEESRKEKLLVILHTDGGVVEEVQNIVNILRHHYNGVHFLVPVKAMSAGTVLALSGDKIYMDYFSRLGPIDPQIFENNRAVPALSYLRQYERLIEKSKKGELSSAEFVLLNKLDLAQLHKFALAANLSISLIKSWLVKYKFKDWEKTPSEKEKRAGEIATALNNHERWFSHGFNINKQILEDEIRLKIDDYSDIKAEVWAYFWPLLEYAHQRDYPPLIHSREFI